MKCIYSYEDGDYCLKHSHGAADIHCTGEDGCLDFATKTNADRIRGMTDEELAKWLCVMNFDDCPVREHQMKCTDKCYECWLNWLKSPVEGDE